jgi:putative Holliday junction resolvase
MSVIALDYGTKRIGVAISDESRTFAWAKTTIFNKSFNAVVQDLKKLINEENVELIVIGTPRGLKKEPSDMVKKIDHFVMKLKDHISLPIIMWDETLTTRIAIETFQSRGAKLKDKDAEAARIILQEFLDHNAQKDNNTPEQTNQLN